MKILVGMNLSPSWVPALERKGRSAVHWSDVGDPRAVDRAIMDWATDHGYVVFTHDLDFGTMLALSHEGSPSVLQIRAQDVLPIHLERTVLMPSLNTKQTCPRALWSWSTRPGAVSASSRYDVLSC